MQENINFKILDIHLNNHLINVPEDFQISKERLKFSFGNEISINSSESTLTTNITYKFFQGDLELFMMQVRNKFAVKELSLLFSDGKIIDYDILNYLVSLSVDHARGIQSTLTKGYPIERLYIPAIPDELITKHTIQATI
ncbi:hypothetical protein LX64_04729 [Chitinophaga skermanii]|uniref:Uncharacterized protein n=1 Tax=Chitinophaga skermanii TaxID=331697 RepID=A0A327Q4A1_9BACT|nr:hypothetical protein [Chitinophaga skermanii]RAI98744.1 hypothetical protein LX64_04729 [Chitinophaga skermanii]